MFDLRNRTWGNRTLAAGGLLWRYRVLAALGLVLAVYAAQFALLQLPTAKAAYSISASARFNSTDSANLSRTFGSGSSTQKGTLSVWVKRAKLDASEFQYIYDGGPWQGGAEAPLAFLRSAEPPADGLAFWSWNGSSLDWTLKTNALYRDPAKWMHIVAAWDSTQAVASDRVKLYVDGSQITSFYSASYPSQNADMHLNAAVAHYVGKSNCCGRYLDGYISDFYFIDGQALTPTSFGETDANGYWRPKSYTGTYGTNGFKLDFANSADLGNDVSSNGNDWTVNNMDATDWVVDTPTNAFATLNPLSVGSGTHSEGNLRVAANSLSPRSNLPLQTSGKWYHEVSVNSIGTTGGYLYCGQSALYRATGERWNGSSWVAYGASYTAGDIISCAANVDSNTVEWFKNGNSQGLVSSNVGLARDGMSDYAGSDTTGAWNLSYNFGQGGQSGLTYDSASGGYFKYTPPSGFKALSTSNLPEPAIAVPKNYFDAATYFGTGASLSVGAGAQVKVFLTSGTSWTVPSDWNSSNNTIEVIGGGGGGASSGSYWRSGGGGGGYSKVSGVSLTQGASVSYSVGSGGAATTGTTGNAGTDTYFCNSTSNCATVSGAAVVVGAKGGAGGSTSGGGSGGASGNGIGSVKYSGGSGAGSGSDISQTGGGGAAGPNGAGGNGSGTTGGTGGNGSGGAGATSPGAATGNTGGSGTEWDATHGSGGGGSGNNGCCSGGAGGSYGGAGGGGNGSGTTGGAGAQGIIVITYTPSRTVSFQPDFAWLKDRTTTNAHGLFDAVRSVFPYLSSNSTAAETGGASTTLTSFLSNGFTLGTNSLFNTNGNNYISWNWKEGSTPGFDIVSYTGTGAARTISHSLSGAPEFMIVKDRSGTNDWAVYHTANTSDPKTDYLLLNSTAATADDATYWNDTAPTASVFSIGTNADVNTSGNSYVAYLFDEVAGFSKFGSYTGNASTDGPFVYTGFKPKYVLFKRASTAGHDWYVVDGGRNTFNPINKHMSPSANGADATDDIMDFTANGFKIRASTACCNATGDTYVYAAFAEQPFQQSAQPYNLTIASSTRFNSADSAYLSRTLGTPTSQTIWTLSTWIKPVKFGQVNRLISATDGTSNNRTFINFTNANDKLEYVQVTAGAAIWQITSTEVFRDPSAWYHLVIQVDTNNATAGNRFKAWVDGRQVSMSGNPTQVTNTYINKASTAHTIMAEPGAGGWSDGYLSDIYLIDGQALTPTSFGETDSNGYWRPKSYTGTYGTNGFHLPLTTTSPGDDTGTNNSDWTANNFAATDNVKDSPTNSYATLSPIDLATGNLSLTQGNLKLTATSDVGTYRASRGTIAPASGKWYIEGTLTVSTTGAISIGVAPTSDAYSGVNYYFGNSASGYSLTYNSTNQYTYNNSSGTLVASGAPTTGDVWQIALDMDNGKIWFGRNDTWVSGSPSAGTSPSYTFTPSSVGPMAFGGAANTATNGSTVFMNFGQGGQSGLTYYSGAGGYFKYEPPTDFKALSTANLPTPTITQPNLYFDAKTYTGSGTATSTWSGFLNFQPDLTWIKDRTSANAHGIFDAVRSVFPYLSSNSTAAETNVANALTAFLENGFSLAANSLFNTSGNNYISWLWKEDATSGFDIVAFTATGSTLNVSHSLGAIPSMIILKNRSNADDPYVWHTSLSNAAQSYLLLDSTAAANTSSTCWGNTAPTASQFTVGSGCSGSGQTFIAYLFAEVAGFSKFGSYTGNGSADGPFVYTGFKPRYVMVKRTDSIGGWAAYDSARSSDNPANEMIVLSGNDTEYTSTYDIDILSNGFKLRSTASTPNGSSVPFIYAAFAEQPYKYSAATAATAASSFVQALAFLLGMSF